MIARCRGGSTYVEASFEDLRRFAGTAAVIATVHDVIITLELFGLTGRKINLTIIAALLALIGYSMNDNIVVFDRLRENLKAKRVDGSYLDLVNRSTDTQPHPSDSGTDIVRPLALYFRVAKS